jgi:hypothetical protein
VPVVANVQRRSGLLTKGSQERDLAMLLVAWRAYWRVNQSDASRVPFPHQPLRQFTCTAPYLCHSLVQSPPPTERTWTWTRSPPSRFLTMSITVGCLHITLRQQRLFSRLLQVLPHVALPTVTDACLPTGMRFFRASFTCTVDTHPSLLAWSQWVVCMFARAP